MGDLHLILAALGGAALKEFILLLHDLGAFPDDRMFRPLPS
ncbi:hypothetical protein [Cupriavidus sp. CP313]